MFFWEWDLVDGFYIVIFGLVEVYMEKLGWVLVSLGFGSFFGELVLMLGIFCIVLVKVKEKFFLFVVWFF